jgi:hypothetical protein
LESGGLKSDIEKLPMIAKYQVFHLARSKGRMISRGETAVQKVQELISFRNSLVHPKPVRTQLLLNEDSVILRDSVSVTNLLELPSESRYLQPSHSDAAIVSMDGFLSEYLLTWCGLDIEETTRILLHYIEVPDNPRYLAKPKFIEQVEPTIRDLALKVDYLNLERKIDLSWSNRKS